MDNTTYQIVTISQVEQDLILAMDWYDSQQSGLSIRFLDEYEVTVNKLKNNPFIYQQYKKHIHKVKLKSFPYFVFYMVQDDKVIVIAVFHGAKNPLTIVNHLNDREKIRF